MTFRVDHLWWLIAALGVMTAVIATVLIRQLVFLPSLDDLGFITVITTIAFALAVGLFAGMAVSGAHRSLRRRAATHGDQHAMRPAKLILDADADIALPVLLIWKPVRLWLTLLGWYTPCLLTLQFGVELFAGDLLNLSSSDQSSNSRMSDTLMLAGWLLCTLAALLCFWYLRSRRISVVADDVGITSQSLVGVRRTVRWEDARLIEVAATAHARAIVVWGTRSHVWWDDVLFRKGDRAPDGMTFAESDERAHQLLCLVAARTGLTPRIFNRSLVRDTAQ